MTSTATETMVAMLQTLLRFGTDKQPVSGDYISYTCED